MWGMSPIDQMICRIQFRQATYKGFYTPPTTDRPLPGISRLQRWLGLGRRRGLDPRARRDRRQLQRHAQLQPPGAPRRGRQEGLGPARRGAWRLDEDRREGAGDPQWGAPYAIDVNAGWRLPLTGLLCKQPPYGGLRAIDLRTGKTLWDRPFGTARNNGPFGIPSHLPIEIGTPNNGGAVVTAGGVIFIAAATDDLIRAIDLKTGKTLWTDVLPAAARPRR
jgi:quinoprotein glucose dehydrogenase